MVNYRLDYPALDGRPVLEGHTNACLEHGHAVYRINDKPQPHCPRCGSTLDLDSDAPIVTDDDAAQQRWAERFSAPVTPTFDLNDETQLLCAFVTDGMGNIYLLDGQRNVIVREDAGEDEDATLVTMKRLLDQAARR